MTHVNTIKQNSQTYTYEQLQQAMANGSLDSTSITDVSVFTQSADSSACTDGKDDGKIGFFSALGSTIKGVVKGAVNGVKGMFFDENGNFSLKNTLKTVAIGAACMIPGVGPFIAGGLCAYGAVKGTVGIAKGVAAAATATTDAEKKAAFESIGGNALTTGLSVVGLKASVGQIAKNAGVAAENGGLIANAKNLATKGDGLVSNLKNSANLNCNYYGSAWSKGIENSKHTSRIGEFFDGAKEVAKTGAKGTGENIIAAAKTAKEQASNKLDKLTGKKGQGTAGDLAKKLSSKDNKISASDIEKAAADGTLKVGDKTYKVSGKDGNYTFEMEKAAPKTTTTKEFSKDGGSKTSTKTDVKWEKLSEEAQNGFSGKDYDGATVEYTTDKGTTVKVTRNGGADNSTFTIEESTPVPQTTTTKTSSLDSYKNTRVQIEKDGARMTVEKAFQENGNSFTDVNGIKYELNNGVVTKTQAKNISNFEYNLHNFAENAEWQTGASTATVTDGLNTFYTTTGAMATSASATDLDNAIGTASQTYATVNIQTGREFDLEDYSIIGPSNTNYSTLIRQ